MHGRYYVLRAWGYPGIRGVNCRVGNAAESQMSSGLTTFICILTGRNQERKEDSMVEWMRVRAIIR